MQHIYASHAIAHVLTLPVCGQPTLLLSFCCVARQILISGQQKRHFRLQLHRGDVYRYKWDSLGRKMSRSIRAEM